MGQNRAQKQAAARAEAERTREGSDNPAAIQSKMDAATTPVPPAAVATAPAKPETPMKQMQTLQKLTAAWVERKVDLSKMTATPDGKFLNIVVGEGWPVVRLGATGGIELPEIKSYPKAFDAAVEGDVLLKKQTERAAKKKAATAAPVKKTDEAVRPTATKPESPAVKKQKAHEQIEQRMQA